MKTPSSTDDASTVRDDSADEWLSDILRESDGEQSQWEEWLTDPWYSSIVSVKLKMRPDNLSAVAYRLAEKTARRFQLIQRAEDGPQPDNCLAYRERNGTLAKHLKESEVRDAMNVIHDAHGHFAERITQARVIGLYYWPNRMTDIFAHCRSCFHCQMLGPLRPTRGLLPILHLQPWDLVWIDYIGPFIPITDETSSRYIILAVEYLTKYLIAKPVRAAVSANSWKFFRECIASVFGLSRAVYSDNGRHFVQGIFPDQLKEFGVQQISALITHPSSVGQVERYVQLMLQELRLLLQDAAQNVFK